LAETFWPGPLTLLLDKNEQIPDVVTAGSHRVAIRVPDHSLTRALLNSLDFPLVAPSANPYTRISPTTAEQVAGYFGDQVPFVLQGGVCQKGIESTIIGWENDQAMVYRLGSLPIEKIESIVGPVRLSTQAKEGVQTPGMARKHYSPTTTLILTDNMEAYCRQHPDKQVGIFLTGMEDPEIIAPVFYARLQEMDKQEFDVLLAGYFPEIGLGRTLNDRLRRAAVS
jgi:L-threonylcarbamoyladenylate synthase